MRRHGCHPHELKEVTSLPPAAACAICRRSTAQAVRIRGAISPPWLVCVSACGGFTLCPKCADVDERHFEQPVPVVAAVPCCVIRTRPRHDATPITEFAHDVALAAVCATVDGAWLRIARGGWVPLATVRALSTAELLPRLSRRSVADDAADLLDLVDRSDDDGEESLPEPWRLCLVALECRALAAVAVADNSDAKAAATLWRVVAAVLDEVNAYCRTTGCDAIDDRSRAAPLLRAAIECMLAAEQLRVPGTAPDAVERFVTTTAAALLPQLAAACDDVAECGTDDVAEAVNALASIGPTFVDGGIDEYVRPHALMLARLLQGVRLALNAVARSHQPLRARLVLLTSVRRLLSSASKLAHVPPLVADACSLFAVLFEEACDSRQEAMKAALVDLDALEIAGRALLLETAEAANAGNQLLLALFADADMHRRFAKNMHGVVVSTLLSGVGASLHSGLFDAWITVVTPPIDRGVTLCEVTTADGANRVTLPLCAHCRSVGRNGVVVRSLGYSVAMPCAVGCGPRARRGACAGALRSHQ
jgi:hypothetical protein